MLNFMMKVLGHEYKAFHMPKGTLASANSQVKYRVLDSRRGKLIVPVTEDPDGDHIVNMLMQFYECVNPLDSPYQRMHSAMYLSNADQMMLFAANRRKKYQQQQKVSLKEGKLLNPDYFDSVPIRKIYCTDDTII